MEDANVYLLHKHVGRKRDYRIYVIKTEQMKRMAKQWNGGRGVGSRKLSLIGQKRLLCSFIYRPVILNTISIYYFQCHYSGVH